MSAAKPLLIAIDWGTSNLRCWLMGHDGAIIDMVRSDDGMGRLVPDDYPKVIDKVIRQFQSPIPSDIPIVICGMAGAASGWKQAPYITVAASFSDLARHMISVSHPHHNIAIIPGFAQRDEAAPDVMRGEETLLYGAYLSQNLPDKSVVILPGTHSKWVHIEKGIVTRFRTTMTGELFHLLAAHSLLASIIVPDAFDLAVFCKGIRQGYDHPEHLGSDLFGIRASALLGAHLGGHEMQAASSRLSGLLIGAEIAAHKMEDGQSVIVIASGKMAELYHSALSYLQIAHLLVDSEDMAPLALHKMATEIWPDRFVVRDGEDG